MPGATHVGGEDPPPGDPEPDRPAAGPRLTLVVGDITVQEVDAIVNAANSALKRGGGVDGAIHRAAGPALQKELDGLGGCPTGECRISAGHGLAARAILHCVGPVWRGGDADEAALLESCYRTALALARRHGLRSLAFPAISTGVYGFPKDRAAAIAIETLRSELERTPDEIDEIRIVCFDEENAHEYRQILGQTRAEKP